MSRALGIRRRAGVLVLSTLLLATALPLAAPPPPVAAAGCASPANEIEAENCLPGSPAAEWDVNGAGDASIQGFATRISVDQGETVEFKIDTTATAYDIEIYRLGYYDGDGARLVDTIPAAEVAATDQPACTFSAANGNLVDCGNWSVSASWAVPSAATSGIYIARPTRTDNDGASHIAFIVRDDDGGSDLLFQTSDTTWQAYNRYGGYSLYDGPGHAHKVSYNRPFTTRGAPIEDWLFNAEYPMLRWLERNGYDVSYFTDVDSDRNGAEILEHDAFLSVGHDEYWSAGQRANVEAARDNVGNPVNLAFFSGNEVYWKTRWEPSSADGGTSHRTLVSYKEGDAQGSAEHWDCFGNFDCDPNATVWTGLWRQNQEGHDGDRPENALSGQISWGDDTEAIQVPAADTGLRFWRNTGMSGATTLNADTLGYEFDWEQPAFASSYPAGRITVSDTTVGGKNHKMSLYRAPSGALVFGAGTVQWSWGLDGTHDRGGSTPDPRIQQATVNLLSDMGAQPVSLQFDLVPGGPLDTTLPTATITDPAGGATVPGGNVTISGTAADVGGIVAAIEVSTDGGTTWDRATGTTSWTYTFSASNGSVTAQARAVDDAANIGTATSVTFTATAQVCPCSIFTPSTTGTQEDDTGAVELGVKFRSDDPGYITGIRFYKTSGNTGTHTGRLWTTAGTSLGTVTFAGESATGWQEATFGSPIAIDADTTYIASYHTTSGNYAVGTSFASAGVDNPPLHALLGGLDGPNGVYRYGAGGVYPTDTFGSSNYLVDVAFVDAVGPDETAPTIISRTPAPNASGIAIGANVTATFSEPMAAASISSSTVELRGPSSALVSSAVTYDTGSRTVTLNPSDALNASTAYTVTVKGGATGVTDVAENELAADVSWSFITAAPPPPPPNEGPGGPILIVSSAANPFSRYYVEILRNEGLNAFNAVDISTVNVGLLADYDVVILGEVDVSAAQATMFETWVDAGGNLIAMRPDADLAGLLGLTATGTDLSDAYLQIDTAGGMPGAGLVGQTIQFHGTSDRYTVGDGAEAIATLYSSASTPTSNPAATLRDVGSNGGQAAAFTFDLAKSVVYTRQGNPAWAGINGDGSSGPARSDDMFHNGTDPDWVNLDKVQIPQADEQQRLLANLIEHVNRDTMPLPRFWYFPRGEKAVVVMTGDDHASVGGTSGQFTFAKGARPIECDVATWDCIRQTSYIYPNTPISDAAAAAYEAEGFEIALHVNTNCSGWTPSSLESFYSSQLSQLEAALPSIPAPTTNRTHCIAWSDWATQPKVALDHGVRLDTNYYYWPDTWVDDRPGHFTGSGMPMRFADLDGSLIDVYQAATQMTDESGITYSTHINTLLDNAIGAPGYYGVVTANMHTDSGNHPGQQTVINAALAKGVPVVSARQMLTWLDGRNGSSFEDLQWNAGALTFAIARGAGSNGLQAMVPTIGPTGSLESLTRGAEPVTYATQTIKGISYAVFDGATGDYSAIYAVDATGPAISSVQAIPGADGTADVTWTTNEPATSRVDYGTSAGSLTSFVEDAALTTTHQVNLTGLATDTTYYFRVTSADGAGNPSTSPAPPAAPATFTTPTAVATDTSVADFAAGTTGASTYVSNTDGGEVILAPTVGAEFSGTSLPGGWSTGSWNAGSSTAVGSGNLTVDGSWARADGLVAAGRAIEFAGTFSGATFQNAGFGVTLNAGGESWAMFGTNATAGILQARIVDLGGPVVDVALGAQYIGSEHRFRIEWDTAVRFYIDGALVHTAATVGGTMRPIASDFATGSGALSIDWMRMTPFASPGTFLSRVHDAGSPGAEWGALSVVADAPAGTTLALSVRTGETPTPDGSWSNFAPVASGEDVATSDRYLQYSLVADSTNGNISPALESVTLPYSALVDSDPPGISGRTPAPGATNVAIGTDVAVTFDEAMNPATITTSTLTLRAEGAGADVAATVTYAGATATLDPLADLAPDTDYTVTVAASVTDSSGNQLGAPETWTFTTSAPLSYLVDTTVADFGAGTTGASTYVSDTDGGEVILAPTVGAEFSGTTPPSGWLANLWAPPGGSVTVAGGSLAVDQAAAWTSAFYTPGRSLEFVANFSDPNQHAGFANDFNSGQWAIFSSGASGDQLYARTNASGGSDLGLGAGFLDGSHRYRIEWTATSARYFIDGNQVAFHDGVGLASNLRPAASDFNGAGSLSVDWMRMSPYPASGDFTSRILDAGPGAEWGTLDYSATRPAATGVALDVRTGNTPVPDGSWTAFAPVADGADIPGTSRYIQYLATLTTGNPSVAPSLEQVALGYLPPQDETPPTIMVRSPAPNATGVAVDSSVAVTFSEPIEPVSVTSNSVRLRAQGAGVDVSATRDVVGASVILDPIGDLDPHTTYVVTVTTAVTDLASNPLATTETWSFTTGAVTTGFVDTTVADFSAGSAGSSTYVSDTGNGEVSLAPTVGAEFGGSSLPSGWQSASWTGGAASVAGGDVTVDGAWARTTATFAPGRALEFVATFSGAPYQNAGLGETLESGSESWAMFGMDGVANLLRIRVNNVGSTSGTDLGSTFLNAPHRYRIEWDAAQIRFFVDGTPVHTANVAITASLRPIASDYNTGGGALVVDWLRMTPYASSGTFESRLFDAGALRDWTNLSDVTTLPPDMSAAFATRTGNSSDTDDPSWSAWVPVVDGAVGSPNARYLQYRVALATADPVRTPDVQRVDLTAVSLPPNQEPSFDQAVADQSNDEGDVIVALDAGATDPDNDTLTYAASGLPAGLSIDIATGLISGTIGFSAAAGSPYTVEVTVTDGVAIDDTDTFTWLVTNTNQEPSFDQAVADQSNDEGDVIVALDAGATDPDNDTLTYAASGLPAGLSIDIATGLISGTIGFSAAAGSPYTVEVTVTDGVAIDDTDTFTWLVTNVPGPSTTLSSTATDPTNEGTIPVTVVFGAAVSGFTATDVTVTNGSVSGFTGTGTTYTFSVTANADGAVTVDVAADVAQDGLGRGNTAAATLNRAVDRASPVITLTSPANGSTIGDQTPTLAGVAGTAAGDPTAITVRIHAGSTDGGTLLQTLPTTANGTTGAYGVDANSLPYGTYTAVARQTDAAGNLGTSASTTFTIADLTPPAAPSSLDITPRSTGLGLDWANNTEPDLAGYNVYRSADSNGSWTKLNATLLTTSAYLDGSAPAGARSYYQVEAVDTLGNQSPPASVDATRPVIALVAASSAQNGKATTLVIPRPAGLAKDDVLVAALALGGNPTITVPSGWTLVQNHVTATGPYRQVVYVRVAGASENPSYAWSFSTSTAVAGGITAYRGVDPSQPIEAAAGQTNSSATTIQAPSVTTISSEAMLLGVFGMPTNATIAPPGGMLEQFEILTTGKAKVTIESADRFVASGATGSKTATADKAAVNVGQSIALRPFSAAPPPPPVDGEAPSVPTNVVASAASPTRVDLTWNASSDNVGIDRYDIYRRVVGGDPMAKVGESTNATYADSGASPDTTYRYEVVAVDAAGNESDPSDPPTEVTTPAVPPPPPPPAPEVSFRAASYAANKSATTLKIARPAGTASGDLLLASVDVLGTMTITPPAGWEPLDIAATSTALTKVTYWHVAGPGEPATYVWTFPAAASASGGVHAYRDVDPTTPIILSAGQANVSSTTIGTPAVEITENNVMLVEFFGIATNASITPPSGMTERGEVIGTGGARIASAGADEPHDTNASHSHPATASRAGVSIAHVIILRPRAP